MLKILLVSFMITMANYTFAACTSPISRPNFNANQVLTSTRLNAELNAAYTRLNELPGDCVTDETITSSKIANGTIVNADISASAAIARSKLATPNYIISSSSGTISNNSSTPADMANLSATITTSGGLVEITMIPINSTTVAAYIGVNNSSTADPEGFFRIVRDTTTISSFALKSTGSSSEALHVSPSSVRYIDNPAAGTYTYKMQFANTSGASGLAVASDVRLFVREL